MQRYRSIIIDLIRLLFIISFIYILPTRKMLDYIVNSFFNISNSWFYFLVKFPILLALFYTFTYIDNHKLYSFGILKKHFIHRPIRYTLILVALVELLVFLFMRLLDINNIVQIYTTDWISFTNNLIATDIALVVGLFALYEYLEKKEKEETPDISIYLENNVAPTYKAYFYTDLGVENDATISINMKSNHSIKRIEIGNLYYNTQIYSINDHTLLETLNKDIPIYIQINFINSDKSSYELVLYTENYERFIVPFTIIHETRIKEQYQINQDKIRKVR